MIILNINMIVIMSTFSAYGHRFLNRVEVDDDRRLMLMRVLVMITMMMMMMMMKQYKTKQMPECLVFSFTVNKHTPYTSEKSRSNNAERSANSLLLLDVRKLDFSVFGIYLDKMKKPKNPQKYT